MRRDDVHSTMSRIGSVFPEKVVVEAVSNNVARSRVRRAQAEGQDGCCLGEKESRSGVIHGEPDGKFCVMRG